jgi:hypothetical protein
VENQKMICGDLDRGAFAACCLQLKMATHSNHQSTKENIEGRAIFIPEGLSTADPISFESEWVKLIRAVLRGCVEPPWCQKRLGTGISAL